MNPSSLAVLVVESEKVGGYLTILTLSVYICQKTMGRMHKVQVEFQEEKAQITVSCRDLGLMSRPGFPLSTLVQLRPGFFSCDQVSSVATRFLAVSLISGCDLNYGHDLFSSFVLKG